jgi:hypothetical protein
VSTRGGEGAVATAMSVSELASMMTAALSDRGLGFRVVRVRRGRGGVMFFSHKSWRTD